MLNFQNESDGAQVAASRFNKVWRTLSLFGLLPSISLWALILGAIWTIAR